VRDKAVDFQMARNDISYCAPSRNAMQTGLLRINHGLDTTNPQDYYNAVRRGYYTSKLFDATKFQDHGPYEFDLALRLGLQLVAANPTDATGLALLAQTPVPSTSQGSVVGRSTLSGFTVRNGYNATTGRFDGTIGRGDASDDLQARTGCKATWLSQAGVQRIGVFGKNQNGTGVVSSSSPSEFRTADATGTISYAKTTRFVPPGYTDFCCYIVDDQNHIDSQTLELFGATNPGSGTGQIGTNFEYIYGYPITAYSWSGGQLTVTFINPNTNTQGIDTFINVGDEVGIDSCGTAAWNFGALFVTGVTSQTSGGGTVTITASNPGGAGPGDLSTAVICPMKMFTEQVMASKIIGALQTVADTDSFLFQFGSRMPHGSVTRNDSLGLQAPKRYELDGYTQPAIIQSQFAYWNGVSGGVSPAVDPATINSAHRKTWAQRQHMLAAANDAITRILDYCDSRFGATGYIVILLTDNGYQIGEQGGTVGGESSNVWDPVGGKIYVYEGSERLFLWMRHPQYTPQVCTIPVWCGDLAPTNMDLFANNVQFFGLRNHHCHLNRDAKSLLRLLDNASDPDHGRLMFGMGIYKQSLKNNGVWVFDPATKYKLLRLNDTPSTRGLFDVTPDPASPFGASDDWETVNLDTGAGVTVANAMSAAIDTIKTAGWDVPTQTNTVKGVRV